MTTSLRLQGIRAAVVRTGGGRFELEELFLDEPRPEEVLVRLVATGICATDLHARDGHMPMPVPAVLGHEGAGVVERVGAAVTALKVGDHVVLSQQSCGRCDQCLSGHPAHCSRAVALNFSGFRLDGTRTTRTQLVVATPS